MGSGKRASMREGPLADLFRRTDEKEGTRASERPREEPPAREPERPAEPVAPEAPASEAPTESPVRRSTPDHGPSAEVVESAPVVPSAEERLRNVFSSDIPENIMDRGPTGYSGREEVTRATHIHKPILRVVGVGGAGVNAVNRMIEAEVEGVEFIAANTDLQSLEYSRAKTAIHIGSDATRGLGSGSDPALGRQAALEDYDELKAALKGSDMVFVTAGSGGGTGTGAAPVVARIARDVGAIAVGIVTKPFGFEGAQRGRQADEGIEELADEVDTLIVVPNQRLLSVLDRNTSMVEAFRVADDVLRQGVQGISDLITLPGLINLDFADVRTVMSEAGQALLGIGMGSGEDRTVEAAQRAVESPLLETSVEGAHSILLSITGGRDLSLWEVNEAARAVADVAHPDANIIFGAMVDEKVEDQVWVTVVATGYGDDHRRRSRREVERDLEQVERTAGREPRVVNARAQRGGIDEVEVPEFLPPTR